MRCVLKGHKTSHPEDSNTDLPLDYSPISCITTAYDASSFVGFVNFTKIMFDGGRQMALFSKQIEDVDASNLLETEWGKAIENCRALFDLDNDLGGMATARVWGMSRYHEWIAVCFTVHPTDMVEHLTASHSRLRVSFCQAHKISEGQTDVMPMWRVPLQHDSLKARYRVLEYTLSQQHRSVPEDPSLKRLVYSACCSVLVCPDREKQILRLVRSALSWLQESSGLDLMTEISFLNRLEICPDDNADVHCIIPAKPQDQIDNPAGEILEICEICRSGIGWYSNTESQCFEGHVFVRCGITSLSIQNPSISCFCSRCGQEYLDRSRLIAESILPEDYGQKRLLSEILNVFDTCIYCQGKFRR
ncbi:hypothetical protein LOZ53_004432 [Ophidiomyces ophidiicola]|uniref:Uncharacterized protein n=1 Tax=Ophidiomyces ophidiicola TaxID=1387563 RepID=A0ACB8UVL5_9EURO|nr:uncharacterized protein LOZ57_006459 [Ophidiomyces ophidiicola]KAI1909894.1 hypothetical protein LOZ61_004731 [Ophidiomyces ophidiicola]KAI1924076.1 hypothetical protein LOZ64_000818 [Ophidiomyces ophidiicola]KAI1925048.1 hypothetical protein LOZ60_004327 [Ophidiomyces ophidiicola]KAI1937910.1 hypothetical protein LOZ57_006459 [Ophidiomyces ophidiicola]KAI1950733.1 hypothetical protein LOZ59_005757 [Ophidiomyces ophidiicola]